MTAPSRPAPASSPRRWRLPRRTVRLKLTLLYGALFLACGAALLAITYVLVENRLPVMVTTHDQTTGTSGTLGVVCFQSLSGAGSSATAPSLTPETIGGC